MSSGLQLFFFIIHNCNTILNEFFIIFIQGIVIIDECVNNSVGNLLKIYT